MPTHRPAAARKTPRRRTAERIVDVALAAFNRLGEPNVSMTQLAAELEMSPGNLYYHHASKEAVVDRLFLRYEDALTPLLDAAEGVRHVEDAWLLLHMVFELIWQHRFLYRDPNELLSRNRRLEAQFQVVLRRKDVAMRFIVGGLTRADADTSATVSTTMVVVLTHWLSHAYMRDPRHALEPEYAQQALVLGAFHVLGLLAPYLDGDEQQHLERLASRYVELL